MFNQAIRKQPIPKYLSSDNDPLYRFHQWQANLRVLGVTEVKTVPYVPLSHPFVERLIGTIRREYLDRVQFWRLYPCTRESYHQKKERSAAGMFSGNRHLDKRAHPKNRLRQSMQRHGTIVSCFRNHSSEPCL
jgi:hypothetical protein